jgi:hypothetical protein
MTKKEVREILERVMTWPEERQEDAARVLSEMEEYDASDYRLTDEQAEEVRRPARSRTVRAMKIHAPGISGRSAHSTPVRSACRRRRSSSMSSG